MLELEALSLAYELPGGSFLAAEAEKAFFPEGSLTALVGPSGSGKTSLLKAMAGLARPSRGSRPREGRGAQGRSGEERRHLPGRGPPAVEDGQG